MTNRLKKVAYGASITALAGMALLGGASMASADTYSDNGPVQTIAQGSTGDLALTIFSGTQYDGSGTPQPSTSELKMTWNAPDHATFADNVIDEYTATGGAELQKTGSTDACTVSSDKKTLTCDFTATVPAGSNDRAGYLSLHPHILVDQDAPDNSQFASTVSWTSSNDQISSGTQHPAYKTPTRANVPMVSPIVGGSVAAAGIATAAVMLLRRRRAAGQL